MNKKAIWAIIGSIVVIIGCVFFAVNKQKSSTAKVASTKAKGGLVIKKKSGNNAKPTSNGSNNSDDQYSTDEWMLMGYMAYAHDNYVQSRHIKNNADLVNDVDEDLSDGALKAESTGNNTYHLTNKFGSVDVTVENDDVKVTGDGSTYTAKSELKNTFGSYANQIKKMTKTITKGGSSENSASSKTSDTNKTNDSSDNKLSNEELVMALYLDGFDGATPQAKLNTAKQILAKDNVPAKQIPSDDFLSGLYENNGYVGVASSLSTSHYADFKFSDESDTVTKRMGIGGVIQTKKMSKSKVLKAWTPYKNDLDQILSAVENNKKRIGKINEERAK